MPKAEEEAEPVANKIKGAFRPLVCRVKILDYKTEIRVKVLHEDKIIYEKSVRIDGLVASPDALATYVNKVRRVVEEEMIKTKSNFEFIDPDFEA